MTGLTSEKSIRLLLREMNLDFSLYEQTANKEKAAGFILGMCFVRFDPKFRESLKSSLKTYAFSGSTGEYCVF